jgi:hypothetical protein
MVFPFYNLNPGSGIIMSADSLSRKWAEALGSRESLDLG